ncbi:DUF1257 domain-containing protein [Leptolyngbya sp. FACHB-261]|uniref:DUF1257 domain-containing protein n=1 Tax=Leptolyngbya sp. FACHB-261 TaxID=2692806 RepID=UPI0016820CB3|nr:DUF1257 domain-containing protein [Leptolyngbya sp. FACHB-261]MBD2104450.1 DUF1257 domain-containing protein [Leptolyngbya sp. FACHB-261]
MSHFTRIRLQLKNRAALRLALADLDCAVEENALVRGYQGAQFRADLVAKREGCYDIGFIDRQGYFEAVADFWGLDLDWQQFQQQLQQRYAYHTIAQSAVEQGFNVETVQELEDGSLRVVVGAWQ